MRCVVVEIVQWDRPAISVYVCVWRGQGGEMGGGGGGGGGYDALM